MKNSIYTILAIVLVGSIWMMSRERLDNYSKWYCSEVYKLDVNCNHEL